MTTVAVASRRQQLTTSIAEYRAWLARQPEEILAAKRAGDAPRAVRLEAELVDDRPRVERELADLERQLHLLDQQRAAEQATAARAAQEHELARRAEALRRTYLETQAHLAELARLTDAALTLAAQHDGLYAEVRDMPPGSGWQVAAGERERLGHALRLLGQWVGTGVMPVRVSTTRGTALDDVQRLLFDQLIRREP